MEQIEISRGGPSETNRAESARQNENVRAFPAPSGLPAPSASARTGHTNRSAVPDGKRSSRRGRQAGKNFPRKNAVHRTPERKVTRQTLQRVTDRQQPPYPRAGVSGGLANDARSQQAFRSVTSHNRKRRKIANAADGPLPRHDADRSDATLSRIRKALAKSGFAEEKADNSFVFYNVYLLSPPYAEKWNLRFYLRTRDSSARS